MPSDKRTRLTQSRVLRLTPETKRFDIYDTEISGFHVRVFPSGVKTYFLRYRQAGKQHRYKLGRVTEMTCDTARQEATEIRIGIHGGADPSESKKSARSLSPVTVKLLCDRFIEQRPLKPSTKSRYQQLAAHITDDMGDVAGGSVSHSDCVSLHRKLSLTKPTTANRALQLLRNILNRAMESGDIPERKNPVSAMRLNREQAKERFLSKEERKSLMAALDHCEAIPTRRKNAVDPSICNCIRLLAMTGMRKGEAAELTWEMVDLKRQLLFLPDSKTGKKTVWLSGQAVELLKRLLPPEKPARGVVLRSRLGHPVRLKWHRSWVTLCQVAGLVDSDGRPCLRPHDLRHSYVSDAVMAGVPLEVVGQLVGHRSTVTTARYRHIADEQLKIAALRVGEAMTTQTTEE